MSTDGQNGQSSLSNSQLQKLLQNYARMASGQSQWQGGWDSTSSSGGRSFTQDLIQRSDPATQRGILSGILSSSWAGNSNIMGNQSPAKRREQRSMLGGLNGNTKVNEARTRAMMNQFSSGGRGIGRSESLSMPGGMGRMGTPRISDPLTLSPEERYYAELEKKRAALELERLKDMINEAKFNRQQQYDNDLANRRRVEAETVATKRDTYREGVKQKLLTDLLRSLF